LNPDSKTHFRARFLIFFFEDLHYRMQDRLFKLNKLGYDCYNQSITILGKNMKSFLIAFTILTFGFTQFASGSAPQLKKQAPGYYRFMVGDIEVTALLDGMFPMKVGEMLTNVKPAQVTRLLAQAYEGPSVVTSVNGYLINTGTKLVLIDTGTGTYMGTSVGHLLENLRASGYTPEQVDEIYLTHMHSDHLGGLTSDGKKNYPQAVVRADRHETDYWLSTAEADKATEPHLKSMFVNASNALSPYKSTDKLKPFEGEVELVPGIIAHPAYGHTPGHTVYSIESKNQRLWLFGDMIHVAAVQFPNPTAAMTFDWNSKLATTERLRDFNIAAKAGDLVGAAHLAFPGVGHIAKVGSGFAYTPLAYGPVVE
jgi:glyoxylase-like metal-dependent hydrolase (beta-lactamase superfamily II)